jgi:ketosteroid isomerase-like protein
MSEENVGVVRKAYELWAEGGWDSPELMEFYAQMMHPDFEFVLSGNWFPDAGVYRGIEAALRGYSRFAEAWEGGTRPSKPKLVDRGDRVVALYRLSGKGKWSAVPVETDVGSITTFRDGKVVRLVLCDRAEALEAAGLSE